MIEIASTTGLAPVAVSAKSKRQRTSDTYDPDLEWLLGCSDAALGARGTLAGIIASLERGGAASGGNLDEAGCYEHPYRDDQLGIGSHTVGSVEKARWLESAWNALPARTHTILRKRYSAPRADLRHDEGFGAKDRHVEGSDATRGRHDGHTGTAIGLLGELAALCFAVYQDPAALALAVNDPIPTQMRKGVLVPNVEQRRVRAKHRREALAQAREADTAAHAEWFEAKARANPMRKANERRKVLPRHVPGESGE